jgi:hypothetical protein
LEKLMSEHGPQRPKDGFFLLYVRLPRLLGIGAVAVFTAWGLLVDSGAGLTPFQNVFALFGMDYRASQTGAYLLAILLTVGGCMHHSNVGSRIMIQTHLWDYVHRRYFCSDDVD